MTSEIISNRVAEEIIIEPCSKKYLNGKSMHQVRFKDEGKETHFNLIEMKDSKGNDCFIYYSDRVVNIMIKKGILTDKFKQ